MAFARRPARRPHDRARTAREASPKESKGRGFRDDIQGMRALAVLAIMVFHAGLSPYPGGFVTLDVFFVISGFLITSLLLREIAKTGTLSLRTFYERRARRILPAATVATVGIVAASWIWLSLVEAENVVTDARWATLFAANIRFAMEQTDYFAADEPPSPFQHYWSLSVEEQFYAVLPLVLLACIVVAARFARRDRDADGASARGAGRMRMTGLTLGAITLASFAWSVYASTVSPDTAYFSTFTRVWEFGVGALLALAAPRLAGAFSARTRNLLAGAGLGAIVLACFVITESTPFPGYAALLPVLGTGAIMLAGAELGDSPLPVMQRALSIAPLRWIGDMSYSLYLWHWPILVIASEYLGRDLSLRGTALAFVIVFVVSWASYRYVETPFRRGMPPRLGRGLVLYPLALAVAVTSTVGVAAAVQRELDRPGEAITTSKYDRTPDGKSLDPDPSVALVQASAKATRDDAPVPGKLRPALDKLGDDRAGVADCDYATGPWTSLCRRGDADADRTMVVLGDSHGRHWIPALERSAKQAGYATYYLVKPHCTAAHVAPVLDGESAWQECRDFQKWAKKKVAQLDPDLVVISSADTKAVEVDGSVTSDRDEVAAELRRGFSRVIDAVSPHAGRVVMLGDIPRRKSDPARCLSERGATLRHCDNREDAWPARAREESRRAARDKGVEYISTERWFCADGICPPVVGSTVPLRDTSHMTTAYAEKLAEPLRKALQL